MKLFQSLKPTGMAFVNGNSPVSDEMLSVSPKTVNQFKITRDVDYTISPYSHTMFQTFAVNTKNKKYPQSHSYFIADFEVENAVFGANIVDQYLSKYHQKSFDYGVLYRNYFPIPGRLEWVVMDSQVVFKNTNTNSK
jgi:UDP-N-acetylmuramyl pentapeptide synthase